MGLHARDGDHDGLVVPPLIMEAFGLTDEFLRLVIHPRVHAARRDWIKIHTGLGSVQRVHLAYNGAGPGVDTVVVKHIQMESAEDPCAADREVRFYLELAPSLDVLQPRVYYAGPAPAGAGRVLVLEDLSPGYHFPPPRYVWSREELAKLLYAYARLHAAGPAALPPLAERGWLMTYLQPNAPAERVLRMADELAEWGCWPRLPGLERLAVEAQAAYAGWEQQRATLLHNDVYPPNLGLPVDPQGEAVIVDWEMAGWGYAELDLAYLFAQPFRSARSLPRGEVLALYWQQRQALEGSVPDRLAREAVQRQAEIVLALALTPVAHRAALHPYPAGSAPAAYWKAMFGVLAEELQRLVGS